MFAVQTPQSITLTVPGEDGPFTLLNFSPNGADTSRCLLDVITPDGDTHRITFNVRGGLVDAQFIPAGQQDIPTAEPLTGAEFIVNGVDTRAFNPYTHVPPADADSATRPAYGVVAPQPETSEQRALREQHHAEAADRAHDAMAEHEERARETPEARTERISRELAEKRTRAFDAELARLEQQGGATSRVFPDQGTQDSVAGRKMDGSPQHNPDNAPMAPAPSSPLPGSPPPHPLDQPDLGKVNITRLLGEPNAIPLGTP